MTSSKVIGKSRPMPRDILRRDNRPENYISASN